MTNDRFSMSLELGRAKFFRKSFLTTLHIRGKSNGSPIFAGSEVFIFVTGDLFPSFLYFVTAPLILRHATGHDFNIVLNESRRVFWLS